MKAAMLAIGELYPHFKTQKTKLEKARWHLIKSPFVLDLISALESKGVDANALADKIKTLLFAKKKMTVTRNNNGETEWREEEDVAAIDKGLTHALKAGIGGGYAPEKSLVGVKDFSLGKLLDQLDKQKDK